MHVSEAKEKKTFPSVFEIWHMIALTVQLVILVCVWPFYTVTGITKATVITMLKYSHKILHLYH